MSLILGILNLVLAGINVGIWMASSNTINLFIAFCCAFAGIIQFI